MQRITINKNKKKKGKVPITCLSAYSRDIAEILDKYCDIILVGDSLGMVLYGMKSTREVTLDMMINHAKSVKMGVKKSILVVDMPYQTYNNKKDSYINHPASNSPERNSSSVAISQSSLSSLETDLASSLLVINSGFGIAF